MNSLGERLNYARKKNGYTQDSLADSIGVSRGVIFNLEKNKTMPQAIVLNAICSTLKINKEWLMEGTGEMRIENPSPSPFPQNTELLTELCQAASELTEDEQLYLLDSIKALRQRLNRKRKFDELCEAASELTEDEQLYLLDNVKSLQQRLNRE